MRNGPSEEALQTAKAEAAGWDDGKRSLILTGSHARGDAHPESDLDIRIVGDGPSSKILKRRGEFLISISAQTEDEQRDGFTDPSECAELVPGWRTAIVLVDPTGVAEKLKAAADEWDWSHIDSGEADDYVAEQITTLAEEIHTLIGDIDQDLRPAAAATFSGIATELPPIMTVRRRLLYSSEKELWDRVAEEMGAPWGELQACALGEGSFEEAAKAAMRLFIIAVDDSIDLFDETQREVVMHARRLAEDRLEEQS
jgi:Nucleotidyltransferase domain